MPTDHSPTHARDLQRFNQLKALIIKRRAFEAAHPYPPYCLYKTDFNFTDVHGNSLLHYAAALGDMDKLRECLKNNIDIDRKNNLSQQAIHLALENGHLAVAQKLFMENADCSDVHLSQCQRNPEQTAWFKEAIEQWLKAAFPSAKNYRTPRCTGQFFKQKGEIHPVSLTRVAETGNTSFLKSAIRQHALPPDVVNHLLVVAAANGQLHTVKYLLEEARAISAPGGTTALIEAVKNGHGPVVDYLLSQNVAINQQDSLKNTALSYAITRHDKGTAKRLLALGATCQHENLIGNSLLHLAVKSGCPFLSDLLGLPGFADRRHHRNMYGFTPFDLAVQHQRDEWLPLLAEGQDLTAIKQSAAYGHPPVPIHQAAVLDNMLYRLKLNYRDTRYFDHDGHCHGFSFLHSLYADREDYYFATLRLMSHWNGSEDDLFKPLNPALPQAAWYKNLDELFEQWTNDLLWFQHTQLRTIDSLRQTDRQNQFDLIKGSSQENSQYLPLYVEPEHNRDEQGKPVNYARGEAELLEILSYMTRMPSGIHFEFIGGGHTTSAYNKKPHSLAYYDSNFTFKLQGNTHAQAVIRKRLDWVEGAGTQARYLITAFCFQKDVNELKLSTFTVFDEQEFPKSAAEAMQFQQHSANQFTPLHIAVMTRSLPAIKRLLCDGFCDIHARDRSGRSALKMALDSHFYDALGLFLTSPDIPLDELSGFIRQAYRTNEKDILQAALAHPKARQLIGLLLEAIQKEDLPLIQRLLSQAKIDVNQSVSDTLPLIEALQTGHEGIIQTFFNHGASLFITCGYAKTPLKTAFLSHSRCMDVVIARLNGNLHRLDATGMAAIHHAAEQANALALRKLISAGADVRQVTAGGKSVFQLLGDSSWGIHDQRECYRLLIGQYQFDLSTESDRQILQQLLVKLALSYDEHVYQLLLRQCRPEIIDGLRIHGQPFLHYLIRNRCLAPLASLLAHGVQVDPLSEDGNTPLMALIQATTLPNRHKIIAMFIDFGAEVTLKNNQGKCALLLMQQSTDDHIRQIAEDARSESPLRMG
ncbi:hypothetical protein DIZ81_08675 [Legionella taurinensis]|uniref:Ankyrin repeat domain-containing protein n=1 Tax=Legionella taurinensis TaxID=70611 RepID=A0AB38N5E8_9GAMM|nr:ankyrin repeat domain-containing protein [Legionella taurinensis]MDX1837896.1 ankyrin repeat domain-containing protein [Legionella taurinensis]PUT39602.1 hypothetical protein DB744_08680 [Legionella taurinensis]PUT43297.1 hypothetical protein DB746_06005 [Legionella taurinensis]PUT45742.1 hypothetical protein DB743_06000 [Legionella taurinensis]PUT47655.1 hypothetical protein DB745_07085 [Legionella taurinensis]